MKSTTKLIMRKLIYSTAVAVAALCIATLGHAGGLKLDEPFAPGDDIKALVNTSGGWVEAYKLETDPDPAKRKEFEASALKLLSEKKSPTGLMAVGVDGYLYFSQDGAQSQLKEASMTVKRKDVAVEYDNNCKVVPRAGDILETTYKSDDGFDEATIRTTIRQHKAYGYAGKSAVEESELKLSDPAQCEAVIDSRIVGAGTLTFKSKAKVMYRQNVLVQYIAQP